MNGSRPYIVEDRPMISRSNGDRGEYCKYATYSYLQSTYSLSTLIDSQQYTVKITHTITPGSDETGVIVCCYSPPEYPILAKCPCFDYPEYIVNEMKASQ